MVDGDVGQAQSIDGTPIDGGGGFQMSGTAMSAVGQGLGMVGNAFRKPQEESVIGGDAKTNSVIDGTKDAVAGVLGPWGMLFRGIQKAGQGAGDAVGGRFGAGLAAGFSPEEGVAANWKDKEMSLDKKFAGAFNPVLAGAMNYDSKKAANAKVEQKRDRSANDWYSQRQAADGGFLNSYPGGGPLNNFNPNYLNNAIDWMNKDVVYDKYYMSDAESGNPPGLQLENKVYNIAPEQELLKRPISDPSPSTKKSKGFFDGFGDKAAGALRYAPVAMDAFQLANLKKPDIESLPKLGNKYKPSYVDERQLQNQALNQYNAAANAIKGASSGSQGALRSGLLMAHLNSQKGLSAAQAQATQANRAEDKFGQQFDLNVAQSNNRTSMMEKDWNARNKGNYETQKSKLLSSLGTSAGNIGLEETRKKYPERLGLLYDWMGKYQTQQEELEKLRAEKAATS